MEIDTIVKDWRLDMSTGRISCKVVHDHKGRFTPDYIINTSPVQEITNGVALTASGNRYLLINGDPS